MTNLISYFRWPITFTVLGLILTFWLGYNFTGTVAGGLSFLLIGTVLAVLEVSLSFDNAIVDANKLKDMTPVWQRRFLTWGIIIAVFAMHIVFPLAVASVAAWIDPIEAIVLAAVRPEEYAHVMDEAHLSISAFGGTFLMMVALRYFIDQEKEVHWVRTVEARLRRWASIHGLVIALVLVVILGFKVSLPGEQGSEFLISAICGLLTFLLVEAGNGGQGEGGRRESAYV